MTVSATTADLQVQLLAAYVEEASERLAVVGRELVALEQGTAGDAASVLDRVKREVHTVKGAARSAGRGDDVAAAHTLETVLTRIAGGDAAAVTEGLAIVEVLEAGVHELIDAHDGPARTGTPASTPLPDASVTVPEGTSAHLVERPGCARIGIAPGDDRAQADTVRVSAAKLDDLMAGVGELAEVTLHLQEAGTAVRELAREMSSHPRRRELDELEHRLADGLRALGRSTNALRDRIHTARLQPADTILDDLPRDARDLARERGRSVRVVLTGGETEVDRAVLEALGPGLRHLVRNAVEHGIEDAARRREAGKPAIGVIRVEASRLGGDLHVTVSDDGAGIDLPAVRAAVAGLHPASEPAHDDELVRFVLQPGITTAPQLTDSAGRGVGLDVVRASVESLRGTIEIRNQPGAGVTFALTVPVTIAALRCLLVSSGTWECALPALACEGAVGLRTGEVGWRGGEAVVEVGGRVLPVRSLTALLGSEPTAVPTAATAVIVGAGERAVAVLVDRVVTVEDLVVEQLPWPLARQPGVTGIAVRPSGQAMIVLDPAHLLRAARRAPAVPLTTSERAVEAAPPIVLIAEDSVTTRTLEQNILESAGYQVRTAPDGAAAWQLLQAEPCDLLVADVMMPVLDGIELTRRVRGDSRLGHLPVVMVTSLDSAAERQRGIDAGADAYLVKSSFDEDELLATIRRLV